MKWKKGGMEKWRQKKKGQKGKRFFSLPCKGVDPCLFGASTSIPGMFNNAMVMSRWPIFAAQYNGVWPFVGEWIVVNFLWIFPNGSFHVESTGIPRWFVELITWITAGFTIWSRTKSRSESRIAVQRASTCWLFSWEPCSITCWNILHPNRLCCRYVESTCTSVFRVPGQLL